MRRGELVRDWLVFSAEVMRLCLEEGVLFSLKCPHPSRLWEFDLVAQIRSNPGMVEAVWHM